VLDLLARVFGRENSSAEVAKERLRLVLVHEVLKEDLIAAISRYMEIDESHMDVALTSGENQVVLVANIPVRRMKRAASGGR
jgi:cell division topological specificity factor